MKIISIVGTRPQFIKSVPVSRELAKSDIEEVLVHTGQHFDENMSDVFFNQMKISKPDYFLNINSLRHGAMTGQMLEKLEDILYSEMPDYVMVYGDTNSTLAGALAASKLHIKIVHVEAGLRSFNMLMPEEINRIITDRLSYYLFCPTDTAVMNLEKEGFSNFECRIIKNGDVMQDAAIMFEEYAQKPEVDIPEDYILCTMHRQENTDDVMVLKSIIKALSIISEEKKIILPIHPRTQKKLIQFNLNLQAEKNIILIQPVGYLNMLFLLKKCSAVMTDSGGLQKEAFFFKKPCITLRNETEWIELVENGFNFIAGTDYEKILEKYHQLKIAKPDFNVNLYGNGKASKLIVEELLSGSN
ncbi:MAG: UDP-N-acetylglucosamine 2-epimerase (non-hydrolyzing) [Ignavibacteriaceae bacterium]|nr:UDP-N-acetylglucosamine 2-epimerase (non-hydrolyzing) [Ignavibacteriaceae bacterium]